MYYTDGKFDYTMEKCMHKHAKEWKKIFFNTLTVKIALLVNGNKRLRLKEVDVPGMTLDVVNEAMSVFDKFLTNNKGYEKKPIIDEYDGSDCTSLQDIDYKVLLHPFDGFFDNIEVR